jgi:hypothetical protein
MLQALPSSQGVPSGCVGFEQVPDMGLQMPTPWHWSLAVHTTGFAPAHAPSRHVSVRVHALPSLQVVPSGRFGFEHVPLAVSHVPTSWHWSLAVQTTGFPPEHAPAWHVSVRVQALPSLHVVPSGFVGFEQVPEPVLHVPTS